MGEGLGIFPFGIIDQHFDRKARLGRLIVALAESGQPHGYGIDEDTALVVDLDAQSAEVFGLGTVVWVDLASAEVAERSFANIRLSILAEGDRLQWPGPRIDIHPDMDTTWENEYMNIADPLAFGPLHPYPGPQKRRRQCLKIYPPE